MLLQCENSTATSARTTTDETGSYSFTALVPGKCGLTVALTGFRETKKEIEIKADIGAELNVQMDLDTVIQKVEVQEQTEQLSTENAAPASTLQNRQMEGLPVEQQRFREILPVIPGVIRSSDGKLNIRGSSETQGMLEVNSAKTADPVTGSFSIPVPMDAIQKLTVDKTPYAAQYGGFSGGLAEIETRPPSGDWNFKLEKFNPSLRGRAGHIVGISEATPRVFFGGPLIPGKLNFSEAFEYEVLRRPVRGLAWPNNEIKSQGFNSFTTFQAILSLKHVLTADFNVFPRRVQFANITALVPQSASSDYGQKGFSTGITDTYSSDSGGLLKTGLRYTRFDSSAHGQGAQDMLLTPDRWGGNFFNTWSRVSKQFEAYPTYQLARRKWHGRHELQAGLDVSYRSFSGRDLSRPVQLLRENRTLAEKIEFQGNGFLNAAVTDTEEFLQDHWVVTDYLALDFGGRITSQSVGRTAAFAPRFALAYSPSKDQKTVIRAGAGLFYNRVSLLEASFADNPARILSVFDPSGNLVGTPRTFTYAYVQNGTGTIASRILREPNTSPRSLVTNVEVDRELRRKAALRLSYTYSQIENQFVIDPQQGVLGANSLLGLFSSGHATYHDVEATLHLQPIEHSELNLSYIWSRARGDLNTVSDIFIPFQQPVIRPNVSGILASDVPNRLISWGIFTLPWRVTISPVIDVHTGLPYSDVDVLQDYIGRPNSHRFSTFFSLDLKVYRDFKLPFASHSSRHKLRIGGYSINATQHANYHDVFNNVASPTFGQFTGLLHRVDGFVLEVVE